jgi:hypothetical protein
VAVLVPVLVLIVWIGIYPQPFLRTTEASVKQLLAQVHMKYRAESREPGAENGRRETEGGIGIEPRRPAVVAVSERRDGE